MTKNRNSKFSLPFKQKKQDSEDPEHLELTKQLENIEKTLKKQKKDLKSKAKKASGKIRKEYLDLKDQTSELYDRTKKVLKSGESYDSEEIDLILRNHDALLRKVARKP